MTTTSTPPRPATAPTPSPDPSFTPPPRPSRSAVGITVGLVLVAGGVLALLNALDVDVPLHLLGPSLLVVLGIGVVISAIRGESSGGLLGLAVFVGVVLTIVTLMGAVLDVPLRGGVGERVHRPTATVDVQEEYRLLMGTLVVDLRDVELAPGTTTLEVSTVLGEVQVRLPEDIAVQVDGSAAGGTVTVLGSTEEGLAVDVAHTSDDWTGADRRVQLDVGVGLGEVRVTR